MSDRVRGPSIGARGRGVPTAKARWRADAELKEFENLVIQRANILLKETREVRRVWLGLTVAAFVIAVVIIFMGYQAENANLTWVGAVLNVLLGPPITTQLWRIRSNVIKIVGLPVSVKIRLKKCWLRSKTREEYEECLVSVMDDVDELFRRLCGFWPTKGKATPSGGTG